MKIFKTLNLFKYKNIYGFKSYSFIDVKKTIDVDSKKNLRDAKKLL